MPVHGETVVLYKTTPPSLNRLGQLWMDTSVVPGVLYELIAFSPLTYQAVNSGLSPTAANPTASIGLTAVNGSAATYMRSDGAPALSQSISPTWTGTHTFSIDNDISITKTTGNYGLVMKASATSQVPGIQIQSSAGTRRMDIAYIGATAGVTFGCPADTSIINSSSGALCLAHSDTLVMQLSIGVVAITGAGIITTAGNYGLKITPTTTALIPGVSVTSASGVARLEMLYIGSTAGSLYGAAADTSVINANSGAFTLSIGNSAVVVMAATNNIKFPGYGAGALTTDASGNITAVSDIRIKRNIRPFTTGLSALLGVKPILHGYKVKTGLDQTRDDYAGFSAQNVRQHIAEAVAVAPDGFLNLSDRPILATVVNAISELNDRLATLEGKGV